MSLKDLAQNESMQPDTNSSENPNTEEVVATEVASDVPDTMTMVGDTPIVVAPPKKEPIMTSPNDPIINAVMSNSNSPEPKPVPMSSEVILDTPKVDLPMGMNNNKPNLDNKILETIESEFATIASDMPEALRKEKAVVYVKDIETIKKDLIVNSGLLPDEASTAAINRIKRQFTEEYESWKESVANTAVITIDKTTDVNDLGLTQEEHAKLEKVKRVRLVAVEDRDLANIIIERPDENHKADYVKSIEGSLSKYHVPIPMLGDFAGFKGAQIIQMINLIDYDDTKADELISLKASLIYEKLINGPILRKYDDDGRIIMSYNEFINKFPYQDIDMALYGILCASSMEENSTSRTCEKCNHTWDERYNVKTLLDMNDIPEKFKERIDLILQNKTDEVELRKLYEDMRKVHRYRSPFSGNVYDISYPTISRAINMLRRIKEDDPVMNYIAAIGLYLSRILIYNEAKHSYVEVTAEETSLMLETLKTLINEDMTMIANQIREDVIYAPRFILHANCPSCGHKNTEYVNIDRLIFWKAQGSMVEIAN